MMKSLVAAVACVAIIAAVYPAPIFAQPQEATPVVAADAPAPAPARPRPAARAKQRPWTRADARVCLEFPTNLQIIRCAEKYRYMRVPI